MIIGFVGLIGSGKDTAADYLVNFHQFRRDSFAASLKDAVANVFGWNRELLEGRTKQSREWRETRDEWWSRRLNMDITPRWVLQNWGTEVCRQGFHQDIWVASMENRLRKSTDSVVISDCRFPNELSAISRAGGFIIHVQRGDLPEWWDNADIWNNSDKNPGAEPPARLGLPHASEWSWVGSPYIDTVIENDGTIAELYENLEIAIDIFSKNQYTEVLDNKEFEQHENQ